MKAIDKAHEGNDNDEVFEGRACVESQGFEGVQVTANEWFPR